MKILITYATAGIGHKKAALAVWDAIKARQKDDLVKVIDVLDYTGSFFKKYYPTIYLFLINKLLFLWGILYYFLNFRITHFLFYQIRKMSHILNSGPLIKFLCEFKPDVVVSTHFLMPDVCAYVKKKYKIDIHVINIITDYRAHSFWISEGVDKYCVASGRTRKDLLKKWRIPPSSVEVTGIPVEQRFSVPHSREFFRKKFDIPKNAFSVLLLSGGYGVGPIYKIVKLLNALDSSLSVIVVCGHNEKLYRQIEDFKKEASMKILNLGYVDNVNELMAASDVYVGKAGGISTTEALVMDLPLIYVRPIPGQESRNADFIVKNNVGKQFQRAKDIAPIVRELMSSPEKLGMMKSNIRNIKKTHAADDIADLIFSTFKK